MADSGISSILNGLSGAAGSVGKPSGITKPPLILTPAANSLRQVSTKQTAAPRQMVKSDGQVFDKKAPRGSYVNLVI